MVTIGSSLAGYRIEGVAGRGGMGVVYRARQRGPSVVETLEILQSEARAVIQAFEPEFERGEAAH